MNELERRLKTSLTEVRDAGRIEDRTDRAAAKQELFRRLRRRRWSGYAGRVALAGAVATVAVVLFADLGDRTAPEPEFRPADLPALVTAAIRVGDEPRDVSVGAHGDVWSSDVGSRSLSRIDPSTNSRIGEIPLPSIPSDLAIGDGPVWVALPQEGIVARVSPGEGIVTNDIVRVSNGPVAQIELNQASGALWIVAPGQLLRIDGETREQQVIDVTSDPVDVTVKGDFAWLLDGQGVIYQLDSATGEEVGPRIDVVPSESGDIIFKAGVVWYSTGTDGTLSRLDPDSGQILSTLQVEGVIVDFAAGPDVAWALSRTEETSFLTRVDRDRGTVIGRPIQVRGEPSEIIVSGDSLWMTLSSDDVVLRFPKQ